MPNFRRRSTLLPEENFSSWQINGLELRQASSIIEPMASPSRSWPRSSSGLYTCPCGRLGLKDVTVICYGHSAGTFHPRLTMEHGSSSYTTVQHGQGEKTRVMGYLSEFRLIQLGSVLYYSICRHHFDRN